MSEHKNQRKLRILYVTPVWSGFYGLLFNEEKLESGMPAFIKPLKALIEAGHQVDLFLLTADHKKELKIGPKWLKKAKITRCLWANSKIKFVFELARIYFLLSKELKRQNYDFIYAHGPMAFLSSLVGRWRKIPVGARIYGTFLCDEVGRGISRFKILRKHPFEFLSFVSPYKFILITNDGTKGDVVYKYLNKNENRSIQKFFWLNGVDYDVYCVNDCVKSKQVLFYPARVAPWKRQLLAVKLLQQLIAKGGDFNLKIAGQLYDNTYWQEIKTYIKKNNLSDRVEYLGTLTHAKTLEYYRNSFAVLSLYEYSNLGNVVIEATSSGSIVISLNDGSLNGVIEHRINGIIQNNIEDLVNDIILLHGNEKLINNMRKNACTMAKKNFLRWDQRCKNERNVIEDVCNK